MLRTRKRTNAKAPTTTAPPTPPTTPPITDFVLVLRLLPLPPPLARDGSMVLVAKPVVDVRSPVDVKTEVCTEPETV